MVFASGYMFHISNLSGIGRWRPNLLWEDAAEVTLDTSPAMSNQFEASKLIQLNLIQHNIYYVHHALLHAYESKASKS